MANSHFRATYLIETPYALEYAATIMAGEQSTGTFVSVPGETEALKIHTVQEAWLLKSLNYRADSAWAKLQLCQAP